jgi:8-amino-7-oxononanoate synthase
MDKTGDSLKAPLGASSRARLIDRFKSRKSLGGEPYVPLASAASVPEALLRFDRHPAYERLMVSQTVARQLHVENPFFRVHETAAGATTRIDGRPCLNFSSYDYLALNRTARLNAAAAQAIEEYGTSASASRLVAGERPVHRALEEALAAFYRSEACVVFVSGHATNVSTLASLFGPKDLILHDALAHNSIIEGARLSGAHRLSFPHNDWEALDRLLAQMRAGFERVLIAIEGHYSMDGDTPDLARFVEIKQRHGAFLMVDEAHALGVLGQTGRGSAEHCGVPEEAVDIWMGTLSKTLASCGGYVAGSRALVELLKFTAPGFVYSVGLSPPLAAASLEALKLLQEEPWRVAKLRENGRFFLDYARARGLDTGRGEGHAIMPVIIGSSLKATRLSNKLLEAGINVQPIIPPAVEERGARLRFFLSAGHETEQMRDAIDQTARLA